MTEIKVNSLIKFYTLVLLNKGPAHGYELLKELEQHFGKHMSAAHVYPFLQLLEKNSLIDHKATEARDKKQYYLTPKGKQFTVEVLNKFNDVLDAYIESTVKVCAHCKCEIYKGGFKKTVKGKNLIFCCPHCAKAYMLTPN